MTPAALESFIADLLADLERAAELRALASR